MTKRTSTFEEVEANLKDEAVQEALRLRLFNVLCTSNHDVKYGSLLLGARLHVVRDIVGSRLLSSLPVNDSTADGLYEVGKHIDHTGKASEIWCFNVAHVSGWYNEELSELAEVRILIFHPSVGDVVNNLPSNVNNLCDWRGAIVVTNTGDEPEKSAAMLCSIRGLDPASKTIHDEAWLHELMKDNHPHLANHYKALKKVQLEEK